MTGFWMAAQIVGALDWRAGIEGQWGIRYRGEKVHICLREGQCQLEWRLDHKDKERQEQRDGPVCAGISHQAPRCSQWRARGGQALRQDWHGNHAKPDNIALAAPGLPQEYTDQQDISNPWFTPREGQGRQ